MKILLFYTTHRQTWEISLSSDFLSGGTKLKAVCDVMIHCNNSRISNEELIKLASFDCSTAIVRGENTGYKSGLHMAIAESFEAFKSYDWVIHLHPDVFIVNENKIFDELSLHLKNDNVHMIIEQPDIWKGKGISTDFFAFKPNKIPNFFLEAVPDSNNSCLLAEHFLYQQVIKHKISFLVIKREGALTRNIDSFGLLHSHDKSQAYAIFNRLYNHEI